MFANESEPVLELADYRRRVTDLYSGVRRRGADESAWHWWRRNRERLLLSHPQSALASIDGSFTDPPRYFDYDPTWSVVGRVEPGGEHESSFAQTADGAGFAKVGTVRFDRLGVEYSLGLFWLRSYGGGLFIPFRDATNGSETYGAGRYLLDSAKGADLGLPAGQDRDDGELLLDFNFAYHPSCAWDVRWQCPLAPAESRLDVAVAVGEQKPTAQASDLAPSGSGDRC